MTRWARIVAAVLCGVLVAVGLAPESGAVRDKRMDKLTAGVTIKNRLGQYVDRELRFVDHRGKAVRLKQFFDGTRPVLLTLNYFRCRTLCSPQLTQLIKGLKGVGWSPGEKYRMITVSFDPREKTPLAKNKRKRWLREYGRGLNVDWTFMTGSAAAIKRLTDGVGFKYRYDKKHDQYVHVPAVFFLSPTGRLTRYLHGLRYPSRSIKFALMEASEGRIGSVTDKLFMSCFHFNPEDGTYSATAFGIMRLVGMGVIFILGGVLILLWLMDRFVWSRKKTT